MGYKMKGFSGFKSESVPDGEGEVNLSKSSGLGPRTSFGGSKNPELDKKSPAKNKADKKKKDDTAESVAGVSKGLKAAGEKIESAIMDAPSPSAGIAAAAAAMNFSKKDSPAQMSEKRKEKKVDKKIKKRRLKESKEKFSKLSTKNLMAKKDGTYVDKSESKADYIKRRKAQLKK